MPPDPPSCRCLRHLLLSHSPPPSQNPGYGPGEQYPLFMTLNEHDSNNTCHACVPAGHYPPEPWPEIVIVVIVVLVPCARATRFCEHVAMLSSHIISAAIWVCAAPT